MRVLLTGASGFVGRYLIDLLLADGVDVVTIGRGPRTRDNEHVQLDLLGTRGYQDLLEKINPTHLIHLAWYAEHGKYWSSLLNTDWIKATAGLVEAFCKAGGKHVTISGTCAEYDWSHGYCTESITPTNPKTVYGAAKNATRVICQNICSEFTVPLAWGRIFFPFGRGEPKTRLLPSLAAVFRDNEPKFGVNGGCYRDFLHVSDVASALVKLSSQRVEGCVNISSGEAVKISDVVSLMAGILSADPSALLAMPSRRTGEPNMLVGNNELLNSLGWCKTVKLKDGLMDFYEKERF